MQSTPVSDALAREIACDSLFWACFSPAVRMSVGLTETKTYDK
jgi:hypothetical protein